MANRNVEALTSPLKIGGVSGNNYFELNEDGHTRREGLARNSRAHMHFSNGGFSTTITNADTYYKLLGTYSNTGLIRFTTTTTGILEYTGHGQCFLFIGSSDLSVSKACELHYALYLDGLLVSGAETPHTFLAQNKSSNISLTALIPLETGNKLEVYCKSSEAGTVVTAKTLNIVTWGS